MYCPECLSSMGNSNVCPKCKLPTWHVNCPKQRDLIIRENGGRDFKTPAEKALEANKK